MRDAASVVEVAWAEVQPGSPRREQAWRLLAGMLPVGAALDNPCPRCGGPHGPVVVAHAPYVASVTYAGGFAIAAVARKRHAAALGVDAEPAEDPRREAAGMRGVLGDGEVTVRQWLRVEAALKADGRGLRVEPATVTVTASDDGWEAAVPGGAVYAGSDVAGPPGVLVSVAILTPASRVA